MFHRKNPLFRENIEPNCAYCRRATPLNEQRMMCRRRGVVSCGSACKAFQYDPLRRIPPKPAVLRGHFTEADFALEED